MIRKLLVATLVAVVVVGASAPIFAADSASDEQRITEHGRHHGGWRGRRGGGWCGGGWDRY